MTYATERRQEILEYVCRKRRTTVFEIASEFEVSERTAMRDLLILSCSYPIYTKQGTGGGVFVEEDYYLNKQYLSKEEQSLIEKLTSRVSKDDEKILLNILAKFGRRN